MRKFIYLGAFLLGLTGAPAVALTLSVVPGSVGVLHPGDQFSVDIVMSGLRSGSTNEIVSAYDLALAYNPIIIAPLPSPAGSGFGSANPTPPAWVQFSGALDVLANPSDKFYNRDFQTSTDWINNYASQVPAPNTAAVEFGEVSYASNSQLLSQQGDSVMLATLTFIALRKGVTDLLLIDDSYRQPPPAQSGNLLDVKGSSDKLSYTIVNGSVSVPEPGTLLLFAAGLLGTAGVFRRKTASCI